MSKIDGYGIYQNSYYQNTIQNRKAKETRETDKTGETSQEQTTELSDAAKELLEELQKKYKNMDFIVADYSSDEEAAALLSRGTKEYSVLIEPEILEEMAADEETKEKYLNLLDEATTGLEDMKGQLGDQESEVARIGVSIDKDGTLTYFADLEKMSEQQRERIEKAREEKKEAKAEEEKKASQEKLAQQRTKKTSVQADSIDELLEKIREVDWSQISATETPQTGSKFDFSI